MILWDFFINIYIYTHTLGRVVYQPTNRQASKNLNIYSKLSKNDLFRFLNRDQTFKKNNYYFVGPCGPLS